MHLLLKGIALGFCIAAPIGPIGILCIRRTLQYGRLSGLFSGLGAALADVLYASVAAFGLTFVSNFILAGEAWLRLFGGLFLLFLGIKTFLSSGDAPPQKISHTSLFRDFLSVFLLMVSNPMMIFAFFAIFAGFGLSDARRTYLEALILVFGVLIGSTCWWLLLSEGVTCFRKKMSSQVMLWINKIAGILIFGFGVLAILSVVFKLSLQ